MECLAATVRVVGLVLRCILCAAAGLGDSGAVFPANGTATNDQNAVPEPKLRCAEFVLIGRGKLFQCSHLAPRDELIRRPVRERTVFRVGHPNQFISRSEMTTIRPNHSRRSRFGLAVVA